MAQVSSVTNIQQRSVKLLTIGQVLTILQPEFAELSPSKLRFLEEQELVTPQRTASGYRKYTELDVDRVRIVLELQRDKYLPLKVIRQYLADIDAKVVATTSGIEVGFLHDAIENAFDESTIAIARDTPPVEAISPGTVIEIIKLIDILVTWIRDRRAKQ